MVGLGKITAVFFFYAISRYTAFSLSPLACFLKHETKGILFSLYTSKVPNDFLLNIRNFLLKNSVRKLQQGAGPRKTQSLRNI